MQGDHPRYLKLAACAKHFGVHSGPKAIRRSFSAVVSRHDMRASYLPALAELVRAGVASVMATYNCVNGRHCCAHPEMIGQFLRDELGFDGIVLSDDGALASLHPDADGTPGHHLTSGPAETAALCLNAQCDLELGRHAFCHTADAIKEGLFDEMQAIGDRLACGWTEIELKDKPSLAARVGVSPASNIIRQ